MDDAPLQLRVDSLGDHEYLVVVRDGVGETESEFRITPEVMTALGAGPGTEARVVHETTVFLLEHQPLIDLPPMIDLGDVAAAYDGYLDELRRRLAH